MQCVTLLVVSNGSGVHHASIVYQIGALYVHSQTTVCGKTATYAAAVTLVHVYQEIPDSNRSIQSTIRGCVVQPLVQPSDDASGVRKTKDERKHEISCGLSSTVSITADVTETPYMCAAASP